MKSIILGILFFLSTSIYASSSMRRCTLLPVTDSVGGAIAFKVFETIENHLKKSNWCSYVSNAGLINIFSRYRESLPVYLKKKEVLKTVSEKLKVGSIILVTLKNEINGIEAEINVFADNGEDVYFSEKSYLESNEIEIINQTIRAWLDMYSKMIPYDAKILGVLGDQITMDVGKGYPMTIGQGLVVKRLQNIKRHPLLKKVVDWDSTILAEGKIFNISDNQALASLHSYRGEKRVLPGDWVRLIQPESDVIVELPKNKKSLDDQPGTLGVLSVALFGSRSTLNTTVPSDSIRMGGNLYGLNFRLEGWVTREYFGAVEVERGVGSLKKVSGDPDKSKISANTSTVKVTGGYKYLPIGFFYGPQIDFYTGYVRYNYDLDSSPLDGFGKNTISGIVLGTAANVPLSREFRFFAHAEFIPFPSFTEIDALYGTATGVTSMELELGIKYQYLPRISLDGSVETLSNRARFSGNYKEVSYKDDRIKLGLSFNF